MRIARIDIRNFRGIAEATLLFPEHVVLVGDNNVGKSTVLEAANLVLGPDRLLRRPPINEHDFFAGRYRFPPEESPPDASEHEDRAGAPEIAIEAVLTGLSDEQASHFADYIEWWDQHESDFYVEEDLLGLDEKPTTPALRVSFRGRYIEDEDDFEGTTFFTRSLEEEDRPRSFTRRDKQLCGFLFLRGRRTGSRALSLGRGSLLDIILRQRELRPRMWEQTINQLADVDVAGDPELGISGILQTLEESLKKYVPHEWGVAPHLRVSDLTRGHLRDVITAFLASGTDTHAVPFHRQGAGTINVLVLALLSQIAEDKQNAIFAMEEPETAIPPYAQKRIVHELRSISDQSILTSHSPYVLEEYHTTETLVLRRSSAGHLTFTPVALPDKVKPKVYRQDFRTRFCEALLGSRVLIVEGATEAAAIPAAARRLSELDPSRYAPLEALGLAIVDAGSDSKIVPFAELFNDLGKTVFGLCDKQIPETEADLRNTLFRLFMHDEAGFEDLVLQGTPPQAQCRFAASLDWPQHLAQRFPNRVTEPEPALRAYFSSSKGTGGIAEFLGGCAVEEIPEWIRAVCHDLQALCGPEAAESSPTGSAPPNAAPAEPCP